MQQERPTDPPTHRQTKRKKKKGRRQEEKTLASHIPEYKKLQPYGKVAGKALLVRL